MAYLDTGELPWDMDLFDKTIEVSEYMYSHVYRLTCSATLDTAGMCVGVAVGMPVYTVSQPYTLY